MEKLWFPVPNMIYFHGFPWVLHIEVFVYMVPGSMMGILG